MWDQSLQACRGIEVSYSWGSWKKKKKVRLKGRAVWVLEDALGRLSGSFLGRDSPEPTKLTGISSLE